MTTEEELRFRFALRTSRADGTAVISERATSPHHVRHCRQFGEATIDKGFAVSNPFKTRNLSAQVKTNKEKHFYIDPDLSSRVIDPIPNLMWCLRWTLMRYQGLRVPSDMNVL